MSLEFRSWTTSRVSRSRRIDLWLCLSLCLCLNARGASFEVDGLDRLTLSGQINPGDAERAVLTILSIQPIMKGVYLLPSSFVVDSKGGDVREAIRIASLVKAAYMDVRVRSRGRGVCASSCFFIYLAGQQRTASGIDTIAQEGAERTLGPLGVHRPYYTSTEGGPQSTKRQEDLMAAVAVFLREERVPQSLIDTMMAHPSNDVYWLSSKEILSLGPYRAGVEEELVSKCGYSAKRQTDMSAREYIQDSQSGVQACVRKYLHKVYGHLREDAFLRMRTGWRPWAP